MIGFGSDDVGRNGYRDRGSYGGGGDQGRYASRAAYDRDERIPDEGRWRGAQNDFQRDLARHVGGTAHAGTLPRTEIGAPKVETGYYSTGKMVGFGSDDLRSGGAVPGNSYQRNEYSTKHWGYENRAAYDRDERSDRMASLVERSSQAWSAITSSYDRSEAMRGQGLLGGQHAGSHEDTSREAGSVPRTEIGAPKIESGYYSTGKMVGFGSDDVRGGNHGARYGHNEAGGYRGGYASRAAYDRDEPSRGEDRWGDKSERWGGESGDRWQANGQDFQRDMARFGNPGDRYGGSGQDASRGSDRYGGRPDLGSTHAEDDGEEYGHGADAWTSQIDWAAEAALATSNDRAALQPPNVPRPTLPHAPHSQSAGGVARPSRPRPSSLPSADSTSSAMAATDTPQPKLLDLDDDAPTAAADTMDTTAGSARSASGADAFSSSADACGLSDASVLDVNASKSTFPAADAALDPFSSLGSDPFAAMPAPFAAAPAPAPQDSFGGFPNSFETPPLPPVAPHAVHASGAAAAVTESPHIAQLRASLAAAVAAEEYAHAAELKKQIDATCAAERQTASRQAELKGAIAAAVADEDYALAAKLQTELKALKGAATRPSAPAPASSASGGMSIEAPISADQPKDEHRPDAESPEADAPKSVDPWSLVETSEVVNLGDLTAQKGAHNVPSATSKKTLGEMKQPRAAAPPPAHPDLAGLAAGFGAMGVGMGGAMGINGTMGMGGGMGGAIGFPKPSGQIVVANGFGMGAAGMGYKTG